ncbi:MAG TPA: copper resistance protein B [Vicinamibacterales bacterium]|nr:copper resistance protein B [Vicinamibacterales bacterium]
MSGAPLAVVVSLSVVVAFPVAAACAQHTQHSGSQQQQQHGQHAGHGEPMPKPAPPTEAPREPIPPLTDADREAAFPDLEGGHAVHDRAIFYFVLVDRLEWQSAGGGTAATWDNLGWVGGDVNRLWFRTEGEGEDGNLHEAQAHALFGRAVTPWWDLVVGVRHDFRPGPGRTWAAVGLQGLAPYFFEVEATAYVGEGGRTHARLEAEYELLVTNRLVLQPRVELDAYGKSDRARGIGSGLSTIESGLRLRYEIRREFAPYIGIAWSRKLFATADLAREAGGRPGGTRLALGARLWF